MKTSCALRIALLASWMCLFALIPALAGDWPHWRGPNRDGISTEPGFSTDWPKEGPKQLWKAEIGAGFSSVSISSGRLFALGNSNETDSVFCLDAETGKEIWKSSYPSRTDSKNEEWGPAATPTVDGELIYTFGLRGQLFCRNTATGKIVWEKNVEREPGARSPEWGFTSSPLVQGKLLFLNIGTGGAAFDKASQVWANLNMINHFNSCVLIEGHLYGVNCDTKRIAEGNLRCIDFKTGQVKWTHEGTGAGTQMAVGNKLVVLTGAGELIVAEATPSEFRPLARAQVLGGRCWTVPVFANGRLYCRNLQGTLVCLDVKSRTTARRYE